MGVEIERKFRVINDCYKQMAISKRHICQGYLNRDPDRTVRVRMADDKGYLTVKGRNHGLSRLEFEYEVPFGDARRMLGLCGDSCLEKYRYMVPFEGFVWEVDVYCGRLAPLVIAEIELPSVDTSFVLPPFVGEEVTGDPAYYNSSLIGS